MKRKDQMKVNDYVFVNLLIFDWKKLKLQKT